MPELETTTPAAAVRATYVKRRRLPGWRKPDGAVNCTRRSRKNQGRWGNPFQVGDLLADGSTVADHEHAVQLFREWLRGEPRRQQVAIAELAGKTLMCWCAAGRACHVQDVLMPLVNDGVRP